MSESKRVSEWVSEYGIRWPWDWVHNSPELIAETGCKEQREITQLVVRYMITAPRLLETTVKVHSLRCWQREIAKNVQSSFQSNAHPILQYAFFHATNGWLVSKFKAIIHKYSYSGWFVLWFTPVSLPTLAKCGFVYKQRDRNQQWSFC